MATDTPLTPSMPRIQLWSCGGGRQSAGIAALIIQGRLPKQDHACMVALEWEKRTTFEYVNKYIRPAMKSIGVPFTYISRKKYATVDFWSGADGEDIVLPVYTNKSGEKSKLPEFCSGEWKRETAKRWAKEQPGWFDRGVDTWIGISYEESHRRRAARLQWIQPVYPLLDMMAGMVPVSECLRSVAEMGWPEPPRSRCTHCPNQTDNEWLELSEKELAEVCDLEDEIRAIDQHAYFHKSLIPLRQVKFVPDHNPNNLFGGGCSAGTCY